MIVDESGMGIGEELLWGSAAQPTGNEPSCLQWTTSEQTVTARAGSNFDLRGMLDAGASECNILRRLFCLEIGRVAPLPVVPITTKLTFVSVGSWLPSTGISAADCICRLEAADANLPGTFVALLGTSTAAASSRLSPLATTSYQRTDGALLGKLNAPLLNGIITDAKGQQWLGEQGVWTGGRADLPTTATCSDWTTSAASGRHGLASREGSTAMFTNTTPYTIPLQVYCFQQ